MPDINAASYQQCSTKKDALKISVKERGRKFTFHTEIEEAMPKGQKS